MRDDAARRTELAAFLRTRRGRLRPADVGLTEYGDPARRRTPGLRREEVAKLSGVSLTWYTWLEQGRDITASAQVVDALARALRLDHDQHRHLRSLANLTAPPASPPVGAALPRLQRLVDSSSPDMASIYDAHFDYLVWNSSYARFRHDPELVPPDRRNLLWMLFTDAGNRARMVRWEPAARAVLSQFRAAVGRRPGDPRLAALVEELSEASAEFRAWWPDYQVRYFRPSIIEIDHHEAGRLKLEMFQVRPVEDPDLLMVVQVPADAETRRRITTILNG
ncbi:helix-turn-helix transcriptional regulator [Nonomuraea sp. NPDC050556]|uniref:helix-turn-helix transcriptional regulator n=1 Tax=Nonomuraea sp. NPDC050556 TaxID=3364369 RepID=UPI00379B80EE